MSLEQFRKQMLPATEAALKEAVQLAGGPRQELLRTMLAYHMGWEGEGAGPKASGKRIRQLPLRDQQRHQTVDEKRQGHEVEGAVERHRRLNKPAPPLAVLLRGRQVRGQVKVENPTADLVTADEKRQPFENGEPRACLSRFRYGDSAGSFQRRDRGSVAHQPPADEQN